MRNIIKYTTAAAALAFLTACGGVTGIDPQGKVCTTPGRRVS